MPIPDEPSAERPARVLIVDDDPAAQMAAEALLMHEGYQLAFAGSGPEALELVDEYQPDAILLDVMMPGMDGFQVCQALKAHERWQYIPVVLLTALDGKDNLARGLSAGADEFLSKPANRIELRARLRSVLRIKHQFDELETMLRLREDLSNMIVHDMRNALMSVMGYASLLRSSLTDPQQLGDLDKLEVGTQRLNAFTNDMLLMAKMRAAKLVLHRTPVNLRELAESVLANLSPMSRPRRLNLVAELPPQLRPLALDGNLCLRMLDNLMNNAMKYSPTEGKVTLRIEYSGQPTVRIQVLDEGPGIPEEMRATLFARFASDGQTHGDTRGIGLGLLFSKMVVEAHGGTIAASDNHPRGSCFTVELPATTAQDEV